jgi:hypothetical protein
LSTNDGSRRLRRGILTAALGGLAAAGGVTAGLSVGAGLAGEASAVRQRTGELLREQLAAAREIARHDRAQGCTVTLELTVGPLPDDPHHPHRQVSDTVQVVVTAFSQSAIDSLEHGGTLGRLDIHAVTSMRSASSLRVSRLHTATVPHVSCAEIARFGALVMQVVPLDHPERTPLVSPPDALPPAVIT